MKFSELPEAVQVIAAATLKEKLLQQQGESKPAEAQAKEVKRAFEELYGVSSEAEMQLIAKVLTDMNLRLNEALPKTNCEELSAPGKAEIQRIAEALGFLVVCRQAGKEGSVFFTSPEVSIA
ncbi:MULTISPECIES: hypothetical protein [Enterobacter]|uniref:hypothetical protein n=1 Tax=Enterobacter TaxID=547 RepID=UPI002235E39E|nr:hypothetical protein [Enterobacter mori]MCW4985678.1 hypothetical protein [Enterobacter mori]